MKIFIKIIWKLRLILRIPFYRKVRGSRLWIPAEHRILEIQKRYTKYDRFLPILAEYLPKASLVIDVGANIGDTAIPMATANNSLHFVCVEPNKSFLFYLELNTRKLKSRIQNIPALIGVSDELFLLEGHGGTRHMKLDQSGQRCQSLDDVVTKIRFPNPISLIKIDTDGFDWSVILSAPYTIAGSKPLFFSEFQLVSHKSVNDYIKAVDLLISSGYSKSWIFDNYGNYEETFELRALKSFLIVQADSGSIFKGTWRYKNAPYFDILFAHKDNTAIADEAVKNFQRSF